MSAGEDPVQYNATFVDGATNDTISILVNNTDERVEQLCLRLYIDAIGYGLGLQKGFNAEATVSIGKQTLQGNGCLLHSKCWLSSWESNYYQSLYSHNIVLVITCIHSNTLSHMVFAYTCMCIWHVVTPQFLSFSWLASWYVIDICNYYCLLGNLIHEWTICTGELQCTIS